MKCRLPNLILSLRKNSQDISESTCKWIPLPPLNKEWTDDEVYQHFNLLEEDIKLINDTNIVGYKSIVTQTDGGVSTLEPKPKRVSKKKQQEHYNKGYPQKFKKNPVCSTFAKDI